MAAWGRASGDDGKEPCCQGLHGTSWRMGRTWHGRASTSAMQGCAAASGRPYGVASPYRALNLAPEG